MPKDRYQQALEAILDLARTAVTDSPAPAPEGSPVPVPGPADLGCTIRALPDHLVVAAAANATRINPVNAPMRAPRGMGLSGVIEPQHIALLTSKYWGPQPRQLSVSFMESPEPELRARVLSHMNVWSESCGISFAETAGTGDVRISFGPGGYWSYLGTDVTLIPQNQQTMNLEAFSMDTPESEYHRVVRHETGHTLGFPHEHMRRELVARIDPSKAYPYFLATQGWSSQEVDQQVLTPLDDASIFATPPDEDSIMCYQLPGSITFDGQPIRGGVDVNATDTAFAAAIYPQAFLALPTQRRAQGSRVDADDVPVSV
jgi:hypothetical protein